jgi:hypothetical protein
MLPPLRAASMHQLQGTGEPPWSFIFALVTCWKNAPSASAPTASMQTRRDEPTAWTVPPNSWPNV